MAVSQFRGYILQCHAEGAPIRMLLQMRPSFPSFWRMHCYYPWRPHISQDSLYALKRRKKENGDIAWRIRRFRLPKLPRPGPSKDAAPELGHSRCEYQPAHTYHVTVHLPACQVVVLTNHVAAYLSSFSCD